MGKKGNWFSSIKKALSSESKEQVESRKKMKKKKWFGKAKSTDETPPPPLILLEKDEQTKHAYSAAAEAAVAAEVVVRLTYAAAAQLSGKSKEEVAAIRIQTAFRGYMAKIALRALRGLVRLKAFLEGTNAKRQTTNGLKFMQNVGRVQAQIQARRIRILEENQSLQRQLLQKRQAKEETLQIGEDWDDSLQSKEQLETGLMNKYEATMRRERALAYSNSHQQTWKKPAKSAILTFMDPNNPQWGWSWIERWIEVKESNKSSVGEIAKAIQSSKLRKLKSVNPRGEDLNLIVIEDDTRSVLSVQSERNRRRHRDDESLASSPSFPSYMASTQSAKAKSRLPSPLGLEINVTLTEKAKAAAAAVVAASVKKRLSFPAASPVKPRRLSGPPRMETRFNKENSDIHGVVAAA